MWCAEIATCSFTIVTSLICGDVPSANSQTLGLTARGGTAYGTSPALVDLAREGAAESRRARIKCRGVCPPVLQRPDQVPRHFNAVSQHNALSSVEHVLNFITLSWILAFAIEGGAGERKAHRQSCFGSGALVHEGFLAKRCIAATVASNNRTGQHIFSWRMRQLR